MKKKLPTWVLLLAICLCAALLLRGADGLTRERIEQQAALSESAGLKALLPGADRFEPVAPEENRRGLDELLAAVDEAGETVGYIGRTTVTGYGGPIEVSAGIGMDGAITGVSVGGDAFDETPGLGALTREPAFTDRFAGRTAGLALNQDGLDGVSGATISSRSVAGGVNAIATAVCTDQLGLLEEEVESYIGQITFATEQGFEGPVTANVGLNDEGAIEYLSIDTPNETDGVGKLCSEAAFTEQFLGKTGPFTFGEDGIEAVTGATFTSNAAINAINAVVSGNGTQADPPVSTTVQGFGGDVTVTARLNPDNSVAALAIDTPAETEGLGKVCSEPAFTNQFVGKYAPFTYGEDDIEAVTGATITSTAVINALNAIVPGGEAAPVLEVPAPAAPASPAEEAPEAPAETEATVETASEPEAPAAEAAENEAAADGADDGVSRLMRERPAFAAVASEAENEAAADGANDSVSRLMRERPAFAAVAGEAENEVAAPADEAPADEATADEATAATDADPSRLMRERPAFDDAAAAEAEAAVDEATSDEADATADADPARLMRERPAFDEATAEEADAPADEAPADEATVDEATSDEAEAATDADPSRLMRVRPTFDEAAASEADALAEEADAPADEATAPEAEAPADTDASSADSGAARLMRERPAF